MPNKVVRATPISVKAHVEDAGHTLVVSYVNAKTKISYSCGCGSGCIVEIYYKNFLNNMRRAGHTGCKMCRTARYEATCMKKYGVRNAAQLPENQAKMKATMLERHGVEHPMYKQEFKDRQTATFIKNHGVDNPQKSRAIKEKTEATNLKRYGARNVMQNAAIRAKASNSFEYKSYVFPSGREVWIQGYEGYAIDHLLEDGYDEDDIVVGHNSDIPIVHFQYPNTKGEMMDCKFYPDIYLPKENKLIEVKSTFTYKDFYDKNQAKFDQTPSQGYDLEYWIYDKYSNHSEIKWYTRD